MQGPYNQSRGWWFETPSCSLWRHSNGIVSYCIVLPLLQLHHRLPLDKTVVLYAKQRTGSTFTSSFFASDPNVTYLFEPLNQLNRSIAPKPELLQEFISCNFSRVLSYAGRHRRGWLSSIFCRLNAMHRVTPDCGSKIQPGVWGKDCRKKPYVVAKVITLPSVSDLRDAIERGQWVIVLLRDPRGVSRSRTGTGRYKGNDSDRMDDVIRYCDNVRQDLMWITRYKQLNPCAAKRIIVVRYEDLARDPTKEIKRIYDFFGRAIPEKVQTWTKNIASGAAIGMKEAGQPYSVQRKDPWETAWKWRWLLSWELTRAVQGFCRQPMEMAGYKMVNGSQQLTNAHFSLLGDMKWDSA